MVTALVAPEITVALIGVVSAAIGGLFGAGGIYALIKVGPERQGILINTAKLLVADLRSECQRLNDEVAQLKIENITRSREHQDCQDHVRQLQFNITVLQDDLQNLRDQLPST